MSRSAGIISPNMPEGRVSLAAIGERYRRELELPLNRYGVDVIWLPDSESVDARLAGHADLSVVHIGGDSVIAADKHIVNILTNRGLSVSQASRPQGAAYPDDCALNVCIIGNRLICNPALADSGILEALDGLQIISVKQGYCRCCVCSVDRDSIITSDHGIAKVARKSGLSVLAISPGGVILDGFEHGFIGGSSFKLSAHELAFTGRLDSHPDRDAILSFLDKRGIEPVFLTERPIFDIGSAVLLREV